MWEPLGGAPVVYTGTTTPSTVKWANVDFKELVYLMNGTCLRVALILSPGELQPMLRRKGILARNHKLNLSTGNVEEFCRLCC